MKKFFWYLMILMVTAPLWAGEDDYGKIHPKAPAELSQFEFLKGKWDVDTRWKKKDGTHTDYKATFTCSWVVGGTVFQQEWKGPYTTGREFRRYNAKKGKWEGYNIYMGNGWVPTECVFKNGQMIVFIHVDDQRGKFLARETYFNITENSWEMKSERSSDDGKTWEEGNYSLKATRSE